jgi:hypothetical protein
MLHAIMITLSLALIIVQATRPAGNPIDLVNLMYTILVVKYSHTLSRTKICTPQTQKTYRQAIGPRYQKLQGHLCPQACHHNTCSHPIMLGMLLHLNWV